MKRLLISFIAAIICMCSFAQEQKYPFPKCKGVELTAGITIKDITDGLVKSGCKLDKEQTNADMSILWGTFCNYDCKFMVLPCNQNREMASILSVQLPERDSWKQLKADYDNMKSILSQKYFKQSEEDYFDDSYVAETTSDYLKLHALQENECTFRTKFDVADCDEALMYGFIVLSISHVYVDYKHYDYVSVSYFTSANVFEQMSSISDI